MTKEILVNFVEKVRKFWVKLEKGIFLRDFWERNFWVMVGKQIFLWSFGKIKKILEKSGEDIEKMLTRFQVVMRINRLF